MVGGRSAAALEREGASGGAGSKKRREKETHRV